MNLIEYNQGNFIEYTNIYSDSNNSGIYKYTTLSQQRSEIDKIKVLSKVDKIIFAGSIIARIGALYPAVSFLKSGSSNKDESYNIVKDLDTYLNKHNIKKYNRSHYLAPINSFYMNKENTSKFCKLLGLKNIDELSSFFNKDFYVGDQDKKTKGSTRFVSIDDELGPETFAHEIGHSMNDNGTKFSKAIMIGYQLNGIFTKLMLPLGIALGFYSFKNKLLGVKNPRLFKLQYITPLIISIPTLIEEGMASVKAINLLKSLGMNDKMLKVSKINLSKAYLTYVSNIFVSYSMLEFGKWIGGKLAKYYYKGHLLKLK
jgi:hypothetical protein